MHEAKPSAIETVVSENFSQNRTLLHAITYTNHIILIIRKIFAGGTLVKYMCIRLLGQLTKVARLKLTSFIFCCSLLVLSVYVGIHKLITQLNIVELVQFT